MRKVLRNHSIREGFGSFFFILFVGSLIWLVHSHASTHSLDDQLVTPTPTPRHGPKNKPTPRCPHCAPAGDQEIYIPLIDIPEAAGSELVFNCRSPHEMNVTPVFYKRNGEMVTGDPVTVESAEIRYADIMQLLPERYRHEKDWGGFSLVYTGFNREMWSQFRFVGVNGGTSIDEFFTVKSESRADEFDAAWWMPEKSEAIIALGNITDTATSATVSFGDDHDRHVEIPPHGTEVLRYNPEKQEPAQSAVIAVTGAAGSIVPTGLITSKDGSFNSVIRFYAPKLAKQANLYANGFRVTGHTPHMVLRNTTADSIAVAPKFTPIAGSSASPLTLSQVSLAPFETKEVDLSDLSHAARNRLDLNVVSVEITDLAGPGSVIGSLYGINSSTGINYDIPLRDSGLVRTMTGSYPWKISDDFTTVVYITNISDQEAQFVGEVNCQGGKVALDPRKLQPGETAVFDLQKFRDSQTPDGKGNKLPRDVTIGQFKWSIFGVTNGKLLLVGRAEMVSRSQHISSSYSCNDPCPPYIWGYMDPFPPPVIIVSGNAQSSVWYWAQYDSGFLMGPYSYGADWSIDTSAGSVSPDSGQTTTVTGIDGGDGCVTADMGWQERYAWDGQNCYDENVADHNTETECTDFAPNIRRLQYLNSGGNHDILGTLYVLKGTTVTFNALPDPPGATFSTSQPHWSGTSGITGNGQSRSATFNTVSTSATDYKTVVATAGNTMTANVIVLDLSASLTPAENFDGRSTSNFGIHEVISLSFTVTPQDLTAAAVGGLQWQQTAGSGNMSDASNDGTGTYHVADSPESATVQLKMLDGPSMDAGPSKSINAVAPNDGQAQKFGDTIHYQNWWSCGFEADDFIFPKDVSFYNLFFFEEDVGATGVDWLAFLDNVGHNPLNQALRIGAPNISTGAVVVSNGDTVFSGKYRNVEHGPYADGAVSWGIPWDYSVTADPGTWHRIVIATQTATSTATGRCAIHKRGTGDIICELTDTGCQ